MPVPSLSNPPSVFQGFMNEVFRWSRGKCKPFTTGHNQLPSKTFSATWTLPTFTANSLQISVRSAHHSSQGPAQVSVLEPFSHKGIPLKEAFCTAPTLAHPNLELPFIVEVDASTTGVGAILFQWQGEPPVLHPCAFYSHKLSLSDIRYYDMDKQGAVGYKGDFKIVETLA